MGEEVIIFGIRGEPKLHLVATTKLLKAYCKKQTIYAIKLNTLDRCPLPTSELAWLTEYMDTFREELTQLPPSKDVDPAIDLILGAQPISKQPYNSILKVTTHSIS